MMIADAHSVHRRAEASRLEHVRWIGGGSGAGKSTVAARLAAKHGFRVYHIEPFSQYLSRTTPASAPLLHAFVGMDMDERWVHRSPEAMYETFHGFHGECFDLIVEDLLSLSPGQPVLVDGFAALPRLVLPLVVRPSQAVWLVPTPEFRRAAFDSRGSTWVIPEKTSDPERALANLLRRDELFSETVRREAVALGGQVIEVGRGLSEPDLETRVGQALAVGAS
jgi:hypothetical protein